MLKEVIQSCCLTNNGIASKHLNSFNKWFSNIKSRSIERL